MDHIVSVHDFIWSAKLALEKQTDSNAIHCMLVWQFVQFSTSSHLAMLMLIV